MPDAPFPGIEIAFQLCAVALFVPRCDTAVARCLDIPVEDDLPVAFGRDRTAAGPTAPACGLTFMGVDYDPAELVVLD